MLSGDGSGVAGRSEVGEVAMEDSGADMTAVAAMLFRSKKGGGKTRQKAD